ncbi:MAG TPA: response regulator [Dehalococcoidia bacterium]|nr:response regulator [Dehalococcoidia bacterium]
MNVAAPARTRPRVLVVDDEMGPRESLRMLLKPHYEILTAASARAALEMLQEFRPDLVILDIKMPEMDGLEALRRIKRFDPSIEVVMITAYASLETVKLALSHGAFEYLIKPFSRQDLDDVVRRALLRRQTDLGTRSQLARLVEEMRSLSAKTHQLEEAARREAAEQSLRVTQLSILREIARAIVGQLDIEQLTTAVSEQLRRALGYDAVSVTPEAAAPPAPTPCVVTCAIRDAEGPLGWLVVDNRASGRPIDPRERELLEMLSEYLAVAVRNSRLYTEIATTKRSLEQLIASAGDGIIAVDQDDRVDGWNPAAERIFGRSAREAIGRTVTEFLPLTHYHPARRRLEAGSPMEAFEVTVPRPGGQSAALQVTLSALRDRQGGLAGVIAIVRDITVQREMESQLNQSEKLTALGQLAGGIAHDFNNLLQAILGYAQLMKQNLSDSELVRRSLQVLESAALDGSETVRRIQQFARLRPDEQLVPVDLNRVVHEALAIIRPRWDEKVAHENRRLDLRLDLGSVPPVNGRPAALTESLTNLFLNAIDAMPEGGVLSVSTRTEGGQAVVQVADTGIGMSEAVRRRIFEPFFSTKGEGGSGLGLAMVYSIVKRHGGEIRVDSEPGRGAIFTLTFPAATDQRREPNGPDPVGPRRRARVLVVDDDPQVLRVLDETLQSLGHTVSALPSGPAALAAYQPGRFDVVLTNVGMAGMNGWEFAERLRARDARVPLLFITGWGLREEDHARLAALAVQRCLYKPVKPTDLDLAIQAALPAASASR